MIQTKDLEEFITHINTGNNMLAHSEIEYIAEIVARLKERDKLKEGIEIERLCLKLSNEVDNG